MSGTTERLARGPRRSSVGGQVTVEGRPVAFPLGNGPGCPCLLKKSLFQPNLVKFRIWGAVSFESLRETFCHADLHMELFKKFKAGSKCLAQTYCKPLSAEAPQLLERLSSRGAAAQRDSTFVATETARL